MTQPWPDVAPADYWEDRYAGSDRVWSGNPNRTLVDVAGALKPGRALDLGCGEGADAIWLATQGWDVTGIDISATAVRRAAAARRPHPVLRGRSVHLGQCREAMGPDGRPSALHDAIVLLRYAR